MRPNVLHFRGRAEFSDDLRQPLSESKQLSTNLPTGWWEVEYPAEREEVLYHGPIFRNANSMQIDGHVGWTRLTAPSVVELAGSRGCVGWLTSPGLLDSAMFSCGVYAWSNFDKVIAIPHRIESLRLGRSATPGETCYQRFEFLELQNNHALFDFELFGHDGQRILRVEKYSAIVIRDGRGIS
jgi:hypothetical protein